MLEDPSMPIHDVAMRTDAERDLPPFVYTPLAPGLIRLLTPEPLTGSHGQYIGNAWRILDASFDDSNLQFDALSYTWGSHDEKFPISLNGHRFHVHHNLYTALPYLAKRRIDNDRRLPIWIDAICINQADGAEKSLQIAGMHRIYRQARMVWVWLGLCKAQGRIPEAISLLEPMAIAAQDLGLERVSENTPGLSDMEPSVFDAISHLLLNPWFRRVWVVQEAALARNLCFLCGVHAIDPQLLDNAMRQPFFLPIKDLMNKQFPSHEIVLSHAVFNIRGKVQTVLANPEKFSDPYTLFLVSYQIATKGIDCLLPEDRVRGLLGLCKTSALAELLDSKDTHNLSVMYTKFAKYILTQITSNNKLWWFWLNLAFDDVRIENLPSWVPDVHHRARASVDSHKLSELAGGISIPGAASKKPSRVRSGRRLNELVFNGKLVDHVFMVCYEVPGQYLNSKSPLIDRLRYLCNLADWEDALAEAIFSAQRQYATLDQSRERKDEIFDMETMWRTLSRYIRKDLVWTLETHSQLRTALQGARHIAAKYGVIEQGLNPAQKDGIKVSEADKSELLAMMKIPLIHRLSRVWNLRLFFTKKHRFGCTIWEVKPGDLVCVFSGAPVVYILRRAGDSNDGVERWRFVGDAIVHGLSNGEADDMEMEERDIVMV